MDLQTEVTLPYCHKQKEDTLFAWQQPRQWEIITVQPMKNHYTLNSQFPPKDSVTAPHNVPYSSVKRFSLFCFIWLACQEATVRTGYVATDWFQIGKGVRQGCILSPCLFNLYAEYIMWNAKLDEAQLESWLQGEIPITSDMQMTPSL